MRAPKPVQEDPAVKAAREAEQRRAETARTEETQALLIGDTMRRLRRFGRIGTGGSVPIYGAATSTGTSGVTRTTSSATGGGRVTGVTSTGGGGQKNLVDQVSLY